MVCTDVFSLYPGERRQELTLLTLFDTTEFERETLRPSRFRFDVNYIFTNILIRLKLLAFVFGGVAYYPPHIHTSSHIHITFYYLSVYCVDIAKISPL